MRLRLGAGAMTGRDFCGIRVSTLLIFLQLQHQEALNAYQEKL